MKWCPDNTLNKESHQMKRSVYLWKPFKPRHTVVVPSHKTLFSKCASWNAVSEFRAKPYWFHTNVGGTQHLWTEMAYNSLSSICSKTESLKHLPTLTCLFLLYFNKNWSNVCVWENCISSHLCVDSYTIMHHCFGTRVYVLTVRTETKVV